MSFWPHLSPAMTTSEAHQAGAGFSCAAVCPFSLPPCWLWGQGWTCGEKEWIDAFRRGTTHKRWKPQWSPSTSSCFNSFLAKVQEQMSVRVWVKGQFRKAGWNHLLGHWSKIQWEKFSLHFQSVCGLCGGHGDVGRAENGLWLLVLCLFSTAFLQLGDSSCLFEALVCLMPWALIEFC